MTISNQELMTKARNYLTGNWGVLALASFFYALICDGLFVPSAMKEDLEAILANLFIVLFILSPLYVGSCSLYLDVSRGNKVEIGGLFQWFKNGTSYWRALLLGVLELIYLTLWTMLLIIPGILAFYSYSMAEYVLTDNPDITPDEALSQSRKLMYGSRWRLFCLQLRFTGWALLCIPTLGIGFFWLGSYYGVAKSLFYNNLLANGTEPQVIV